MSLPLPVVHESAVETRLEACSQMISHRLKDPLYNSLQHSSREVFVLLKSAENTLLTIFLR